VAAGTRAKTAAVRIFIAHLVAYPIAFAWALGSIPAVIVGVVTVVGTNLDDADVAHRVLVRVLWPFIGSAVLAHLAGVVWGLDRNEKRGKRIFVVSMAALGGIPVLVGGGSWIWLMTR
jgi:hypothetical protein